MTRVLGELGLTMAAPELPIHGVAVLDDNRNFAAAVCKALDRGLQDEGAIQGVTAALMLDTITPDSTAEGQLGVRSYLRRLAAVLAAVDGQIAGQPILPSVATVPRFLFCDVLLPDYEADSSSLSLRTAERIRELLTLIYRRWKTAFPDSKDFPFRVQFWSEWWERIDSRAGELVTDRLTGEPLEWAHYRTKPHMASRFDLDSGETKGLFRQMLGFRPGIERLPGWLFAGVGGQTLRARIKTLVRTSASCVVVSDSRVARVQAAREFVASTGLQVRSRHQLTTLRQLHEQWESSQDAPVALAIDLTALEYDEIAAPDAHDLFDWMASSRRSSGGHQFVFQVEPQDAGWRALLKKSFGSCELAVPAPGDRVADVPRMVRARCGREVSERDCAVLEQRAQFLSYEDIDRLDRDETRPPRAFGDQDWEALGLRPEELLVRLVLSKQGGRVSLAFDECSTDLTHMGQKQNAWALLCIFAQQSQGTAERLELSLTEAPALAERLRAQWPRLWQQASTTQVERRVFNGDGRWQCDFARDTTGGIKLTLTRWFGSIGLQPPIKLNKKDDHIAIEWGYPLAIRLIASDDTRQILTRVAPRRRPRPTS